MGLPRLLRTLDDRKPSDFQIMTNDRRSESLAVSLATPVVRRSNLKFASTPAIFAGLPSLYRVYQNWSLWQAIIRKIPAIVRQPQFDVSNRGTQGLKYGAELSV
jgi:hypothetical protein